MRDVYSILKEWKKESGVDSIVQFKYSSHTGDLTIYTSRPGFFIGKAGKIFYKYQDILRSKVIGFKNVNLVETDYRIL